MNNARNSNRLLSNPNHQIALVVYILPACNMGAAITNRQKFYATSIIMAIFLTIAPLVAHAENNCTGATYYDTTSDDCRHCPNGFDYDTSDGKTDISQCQILCPAGTYVAATTACENTEYANIPVEYIPIEYLESTGTQYINTGYKQYYDKNVKLEIDFMATTAIGWMGGNGYTQINLRYMPAGIRATATATWDGTQHLWQMYVNDEMVDHANWPQQYNNRDIFLFGLDITWYARGKLYSAKIYNENGEIAALYIPVCRASDNACGIYDTISGQFFTNNGTGDFTAGAPYSCKCTDVGVEYWSSEHTAAFGQPDTRNKCPNGYTDGTVVNKTSESQCETMVLIGQYIATVYDTPTDCGPGTYSNIVHYVKYGQTSSCEMCAGATYNENYGQTRCMTCPIGYDYNTTSGKNSIYQCQIHCDGGTFLPEKSDGTATLGKYTVLEYIESTGTQYINTGFIHGYDKNTKFWIDYEPTSNETCWIGGNGYTEILLTYKHTPTGVRATATATWDGTQHIWRMYVNDVMVYGPNAWDKRYDNLPVYLFNLSGFDAGPCSGKMYHAQIYQDDIIVGDFLPVVITDTGAAGMYDTITGTFFANAGTGDFIAGPVSTNNKSCQYVGAGYWAAPQTINFGDSNSRNACPAGLTTIGFGAGADEIGDCGRILHVGDKKIYLRSDKKTTPSLNVQMPNGQTLYANIETGIKKAQLHIQTDNGTVYDIYDDSTNDE